MQILDLVSSSKMWYKLSHSLVIQYFICIGIRVKLNFMKCGEGLSKRSKNKYKDFKNKI